MIDPEAQFHSKEYETRVPLHCSVSDCLHEVQEEEIHADEFT
jgi:hypothetical protein